MKLTAGAKNFLIVASAICLIVAGYCALMYACATALDPENAAWAGDTYFMCRTHEYAIKGGSFAPDPSEPRYEREHDARVLELYRRYCE